MLTNCFAAKQLPQFCTNPLIYYVNRYFLMFGGSQGKRTFAIRFATCSNAVASRSAFKSLIMQA